MDVLIQLAETVIKRSGARRRAGREDCEKGKARRDGKRLRQGASDIVEEVGDLTAEMGKNGEGFKWDFGRFFDNFDRLTDHFDRIGNFRRQRERSDRCKQRRRIGRTAGSRQPEQGQATPEPETS